MVSQCESLGTCARKKLSNWLTVENLYTQSPDQSFLAMARNSNATLEKVSPEAPYIFVIIPIILGVIVKVFYLVVGSI